ncbi:hypothetical protein [Bacillus sp. FJAT-27445]|uniref:hypothetical protein n=1 Tax=Bacillus sp. FJAT-27445 TaxID=1679166 RepID=UPI000743E7AA|nr:hypothetical protein [Bacillus sp. FJAT-27445]
MGKTLRDAGYLLMALAFILPVSGCGLFFDNDIVANRQAEVYLTKNNELQFRFKLNEDFLYGKDMFKVKVNIHDEKLAEALGTDAIIYGEEEVLNGEYLEVKEGKDHYILMEPLPMNIDFHIAELEKLISDGKAVSIEVFNEKEVFGRGFLSNFSSEL